MDREKIVEKYGTDITRLNIDNVRKWVKALRSGKYHKTTGTLFDGDNYCALGVAAAESGVPNEHLHRAGLPEKARNWLGVDKPIPCVGTENVDQMNDSGRSFQTIAACIEKYWIRPFNKYKHCFTKEKSK